MRYTEKGLEISLEELRGILIHAEEEAQYDSMEPVVYIQGGDRPSIVQFCGYADGAPVYHTNSAL